MRVELLLHSGTTSSSLADILVEEGHAVKAEESYDSQVMQRITLDCTFSSVTNSICFIAGRYIFSQPLVLIPLTGAPYFLNFTSFL